VRLLLLYYSIDTFCTERPSGQPHPTKVSQRPKYINNNSIYSFLVPFVANFSALLSQLYIPHHIPEAEYSHPQLEEHSLTSPVAPSISKWKEQLASASFYQYSDDVNVIEEVANALGGDMLDYEGTVGIVIGNRVMVIKVEEMACW
jgi:hypothetical protein